MRNKKKILLLLPLLLLALASCDLKISLKRTSSNDLLSTTNRVIETKTNNEIISKTTTNTKTPIATNEKTSINSTNKIESIELNFTKYNEIGNLTDMDNISKFINNDLVDIINVNGLEANSFSNNALNLKKSGNIRIIAHEGINFKKIAIDYTDSNNLALYINDKKTTNLGFSSYTFIDNTDDFYLVVPSNKNSKASIKSIKIDYIGSASNEIKINQIDFKDTYYLDSKDDKIAKSYVLPSLPTNNINPKILVIPVSLDSSKIKYHNEYLKNIKIAFNGDNTTTGFESVKSYYQKASNGLCNLDITVLDEWYSNSKYTSLTLTNELKKYYSGTIDYHPVEKMGQDILKYYDSKIDYSKYDSDNDGAIDSVWFIYDSDIDTSSSSPFWAYTVNSTLPFDNYGNIKNEYKYDSKFMGYYAFAGVGFMTPGSYASYNSDKIIVDSHTYIHETGHLFGLDDYYDYDDSVGANRGLYGASMMDYNLGDLDPYSKLLLNWIDPYVVNGNGTINFTLENFEKTNSVIILSDHRITNIYDSYYMIEYYTNTYLNENDKPINGDGIRILKVNSEIYKDDSFISSFYISDIYSSPFKYNNSDTSIPQIEMIYNGLIKINKNGNYALTKANLFKENEEYENDLFKLSINSINKNINALLTITVKENNNEK